MTISTPVEFWTLNNTRVGEIAGATLVPFDGNDYFVAGKIGQSWELDATASRVCLAQSAVFQSSPQLTLSLWLRRPNTDNDTERFVIVLRGENLGEQSTFLLFRCGKDFLNRMNYAVSLSGGASTVFARISPADIDWHHVVVTVNQTTNAVQIWFDGNKITDEVVSHTPLTGQYDVLVGADRYPSPVNPGRGDLDAVGIWHQILSESEIAGLYNSGNGYEGPFTDPVPAPEKLLVLEWLTGPHAGKYTLLKESL